MARRRRRKKKSNDTLLVILLIIGILLYNKYGTNISSAFEVKNEEPTPVVVNGTLEVEFIDVGQADSILIRNNGENMLIDAGNNEDGTKLVSYFKNLGITNFKYVVGTHPHEDHIGGMDDIINNFTIDHFIIPDSYTTTLTFEEVLDALEQRGMTFEVPEVDSTITLGEANIYVLYTGTDTNDLNNASIVLKLIYGNNSFLFMGDAPSRVEKIIMDKEIKADVLKTGHHGSRYSTTLGFLNKVKPRYAIISCGTNNIYGHPHDSTINKLKNNDIEIYRTDLNGTIIMTSDGTNITVNTLQTDTNGG